MSGTDEPKPPTDEGADVVPIEEARKRHEADAGKDTQTAEAQPTPTFLQPVMAAIAKELAGLVSPDGTVRLGGEDEAARAKTAAVVRGIGAGLGAALADAFGKWAEKLQNPPAPAPDEPPTAPATPPSSTSTDDKKPDLS